MKKIQNWYSEKIGKQPKEFNPIDKHIETVVQTWEKEREQVLRNTKEQYAFDRGYNKGWVEGFNSGQSEFEKLDNVKPDKKPVELVVKN